MLENVVYILSIINNWKIECFLFYWVFYLGLNKILNYYLVTFMTNINHCLVNFYWTSS